MNGAQHVTRGHNLKLLCRRMGSWALVYASISAAAFVGVMQSIDARIVFILFGVATVLYVFGLMRTLCAITTQLDTLDTASDSFHQSASDLDYVEQITRKQSELDALQSQINPHFLYNTLDSIRGIALSEGIAEIAHMTEALSAFFRYSVSKKSNIVTLEEELRNVDYYFAIQQYRFNNRFVLKKILAEDPDLLDCALPKLTLQPLVENALYHGLETKIGGGTITVRVTMTERRLIINVVDDGIGIDAATLDALNKHLDSGQPAQPQVDSSRSSGIALINVNQRIKLLYGSAYGITLYSTLELGTDVELVLPLIRHEANGYP